jgi:hypothetical protein
MRRVTLGILTAIVALALTGCPKPPKTLDLIFGGPFTFVRQSKCIGGAEDCIAVWLPDVPGHSKPILFGINGQLNELDPGDYQLLGMTAGPLTQTTPVPKTAVWTLPGKKLQIPPAPKNPYFTLKLPVPREIVPWNADPLVPSIVSPSPYSMDEQPHLATMVILRYTYDGAQQLTLLGNKIQMTLNTPKVGNEHVLTIHVIPPKPAQGEDPHAHSKEAFLKTLEMLGLKGDISFPEVQGFQRNTPVDPQGLLPDDLLNYINSQASVSEGHGRINDCKAPAVFVDPAR